MAGEQAGLYGLRLRGRAVRQNASRHTHRTHGYRKSSEHFVIPLWLHSPSRQEAATVEILHILIGRFARDVSSTTDPGEPTVALFCGGMVMAHILVPEKCVRIFSRDRFAADARRRDDRDRPSSPTTNSGKTPPGD